MLLSVLERRGRDAGGLVFGTLLGPETTGPWPVAWVFSCGRVSGVRGVGLVFLVSRLQRAHGLPFCGCVWGVWYGVVV
jgi:hypothetical protein